jgi:hypothetical protein
MAKIKLPDACRRLSQKYETPVAYQTAYMAAVANIIPAERDDTCRFWLKWVCTSHILWLGVVCGHG